MPQFNVIYSTFPEKRYRCEFLGGHNVQVDVTLNARGN